jgi:hypothetical protein
MKKIVFVTHCDSWLYESYGCKKLINSFKYFHPDIEILHFDENDIKEILSKNKGFCPWSNMTLTMSEAKRRTNADVVCHLDADSIVLARLNEILDCDYDVAAVRNNNDDFLQDESMNRPNDIKWLPNHLYLNCGCIATSSDMFLEDWYRLNKSIIEKYGKINAIKGVEQDTYNLIIYTSQNQYKLKILDPKGGNLFYGASSIFSNYSKSPPESVKEYDRYHWQSWKDINLIDGKPMLYGKEVRLLHHCFGGTPGITKKLQYDLFNDEFVEYLKQITQCNE